MDVRKRARWNWIVGALIVAAAMIAGAFITRGAHEARTSAITFQAQAFGVAASIDLVL
jgi:hypothetical protein